MKTFEISNGTSEDATLIGRVVASDETEAISTLNAYRNGFKTTESAQSGVPHAYVKWAHAEIHRISDNKVAFWRAKAVDHGV